MSTLANKDCVPCGGSVPRLTSEEIAELAPELDADWTVVDGHHLERHYRFNDFKRALDFVNRVGSVAEDEGHHPDIYFTWGKAQLKIFIHAIIAMESEAILRRKTEIVGFIQMSRITIAVMAMRRIT